MDPTEDDLTDEERWETFLVSFTKDASPGQKPSKKRMFVPWHCVLTFWQPTYLLVGRNISCPPSRHENWNLECSLWENAGHKSLFAAFAVWCPLPFALWTTPILSINRVELAGPKKTFVSRDEFNKCTVCVWSGTNTTNGWWRKCICAEKCPREGVVVPTGRPASSLPWQSSAVTWGQFALNLGTFELSFQRSGILRFMRDCCFAAG